ncbi:MAG TPA: intradiol ring-cleavage dioxygenase [Burkholderiaceae bacterium]|nr:intradiol ring-cleavage dioxygenase [Burkholderiaceae bacterium]
MGTRPNNRRTLARRHALATLAAAPLVMPLGKADAQTHDIASTPAQTLGPFYPRSTSERPAHVDPDLIVVDGSRVVTKGIPLYLTGRVLTHEGQPVAAALVEIWQCDANAIYHHPDGGDEAHRDPAFQGYGQTRSDAGGTFHFRTIKPVPYPGRTAHIHVRIQTGQSGSLSTQLYLPDAAGNERDVIYRHLSPAQRAQVVLSLRPTVGDHPLAQATRVMADVDLVLA